MLTLTERHLKTPKYLQLAEWLRQEISEGRLQPGDRLPSFSEMKAQYEATQYIVERAHALLESDGLIRREPGRGVFVNDPGMRAVTDFVAFLDHKVGRNLPYHLEIQRGVREQAAVLGKSITMVDDPLTFKHWNSMDGVILEDIGRYPIQGQPSPIPGGLPSVRLFYQEPGMSSVIADDASGITQAVEHLVELGHQRIGYLGHTPWANPLLEKRYQAYRETLQRVGIVAAPEWTCHAEWRMDLDYREHGYQTMKRWLAQGWHDLQLTALLVQNDYTAIGVICALEENDFQVPHDVSIVGYDGLDLSGHASLSLTTIEVRLREMGRVAMKVLQRQIDSPELQSGVTVVPVRLHVGQSTAPAKCLV